MAPEVISNNEKIIGAGLTAILLIGATGLLLGIGPLESPLNSEKPQGLENPQSNEQTNSTQGENTTNADNENTGDNNQEVENPVDETEQTGEKVDETETQSKSVEGAVINLTTPPVAGESVDLQFKLDGEPISGAEIYVDGEYRRDTQSGLSAGRAFVNVPDSSSFEISVRYDGEEYTETFETE